MKYSLDDIRTFLAVVESGSISAAAQRLELTKSVVSQRVVHLEAALGVALLHRSSRGVRATDRGRLFQAQACDAIAQLEQAVEAVAEDDATLTGLLRISAPVSFGSLHLGPMLFAFMRAHPRLDLALDLSDRMVDIAAEGYDLAIRITRLPADALLVATRLAEVPASSAAARTTRATTAYRARSMTSPPCRHRLCPESRAAALAFPGRRAG